MDIDLILKAINITVIGYIIVFVVLFLLYLSFYYLAKLLESQAKERCRRAGKNKCAEHDKFSVDSDTTAAIAMALYLHFGETHDIDSTKLTMKRESKRYTPWNSKIYNVIHRL
jgi:Na+-transporting methylmalonyl-CoA/oxaloacetate decarboxylase gamma subunit